jgi:UDP-GlcNAc:undecaprenyl-phosphate/decaprenyl-phosphate GlcNAc-1-phosphate transferase
MQLIGVAAAFTIAAIVAYILTPWVARLAAKAGAIDHPDGGRKCQSQPVPRGGGIIVAIAAFLGVAIAVCFPAASQAAASSWLWRGLVPSLAILLCVGIIDDVLTLTGIYKVFGQVLAVSVLVAGSAHFERVSLFGLLIPLGDLRIPFTIFFCLGAINAFNLIDGADGLASSLGALITLSLGIIACARGDLAGALVCFALVGALIGFLRHNISPARVYLGDTGSMMIGLVVAAVGIENSINQSGAFMLAIPLALCAIPILDATAALIRRVTTGQSVFAADRGHLHHALLLRGWSVNQTVFAMNGLGAITCAGAVLSYFSDSDVYAVAITGCVVAALALARVFGHIEAGLVASYAMALIKGILLRGARLPAADTERAVHLQGRRKWRNLWMALREAAPIYNLTGLTLQISLPQFHESFHAHWKSNDSPTDIWRVTLPLKFDNQLIGRLIVSGANNESETLADMRQLLDFLEPIQGQIADLVHNIEVPDSQSSWVAATQVADANEISDRSLDPIPDIVI